MLRFVILGSAAWLAAAVWKANGGEDEALVLAALPLAYLAVIVLLKN